MNLPRVSPEGEAIHRPMRKSPEEAVVVRPLTRSRAKPEGGAGLPPRLPGMPAPEAAEWTRPMIRQRAKPEAEAGLPPRLRVESERAWAAAWRKRRPAGTEAVAVLRPMG
jgi:hypothetical protein